jgi:sporulation protein YlmC with PRC-barrel domain
VRAVDEGLPISYELLDDGVPVLASDGTQVGTVGNVLAAPDEDVFHGLLVKTPSQGVRFVEADHIASIHEHGVDLRIDAAAALNLPAPEHAAPVYHEDPAKQHGKWSHWVHHLSGRGDWDRER